MSENLIPLSHLQAVQEQLIGRLSQRGLVPLPIQGHELYESDVSFLYDMTGRLWVLIHVPVYYHDTLLDAYQYNPSPIQVSPKHFLLPQPDKVIIAVDSCTNSLLKTMSLTELTLCHKSGSKFFCKNQNHYFKEPYGDCLMGLFKNQLQLVKDQGKFSPVAVMSDFISQLGPEEFLIYQANAGRIEMTCLDTAHKAQFKGIGRVKVPVGCRGNAYHFAFDGEVSVMVQDDFSGPHYQVAFNLTTFLGFGIDLDMGFKQILHEIQLMGSPDGVTIEDISKCLRQGHQSWVKMVGFGTSLGFIAVILSCICCCGCQKLMRSLICPQWPWS